MRTTDSQELQPIGAVADDHDLTHRARAYGEAVIQGNEWPLDGVDLERITWATSTRARRRHGRCSYDGDGRATITLTEHTYKRAGFAACKKTIRHELVHAWQYQHRGEQAVATDSGIKIRARNNSDTSHTIDNGNGSPGTADADTAADVDSPSVTVTETGTEPPTETERGGFLIDTGHGDSFRAWVDPLELPGRCSTYYDRRRADFAYVYECPDCGNWWGKHRLCKSVRQAAHGGEGSTGYRYCTGCEVLLHLRAGESYLAHGDHGDETIRAFVNSEFESTTPDSELPLLDMSSTTGIERPE